MLFLGSNVGYLAALHEKEWGVAIYKVPRNDEVINQIIINNNQMWNKIEKFKAECL